MFCYSIELVVEVLCLGVAKVDDPNAYKFGKPKADADKTPVTVSCLLVAARMFNGSLFLVVLTPRMFDSL